MRVLITGATGFLGGNLARRLRARGHAVKIFARPSPRADALVKEGFDVAWGDVADPGSIEWAVAGVEAVVHLAALYRTEGVPLALFNSVNVEGTRHVVDACERAGVRRLVHVSTVGVYGELVDVPATEAHRCKPVDHYQRTKWGGEQIVRRAMTNGLRGRAVVVRPTGVYGPGDLRFLKIFRAIARRRMIVPGPAKALYHPTYIDDFVDGMELILTLPNAAGGTYQLAGPRYMPMREYLRTLARSLGVSEPRWHVPLLPLKVAAHVCEHLCRLIRVEPPLYPRRLGFFQYDRAFSTEHAKRDLGFAPKVELEEGARNTAAWYREQGLL